jgi:hypothetical protein
MRTILPTEIVPWMMLSAAMRVFSVHGGLTTLIAIGLSDICLFIAFLLGAHRMIHLADGSTGIGRLTLRQQLTMAHKVLLPVAGLIVATSVTMSLLGWRWIGHHMLLGFDGIAYDQRTIVGFVWSAFLAALTLLMVLRVETAGNANLFAVLRELAQRARHMVPAIAAIAAADVALNIVQGMVRHVVYAFWVSNAAPSLVRALAFFAFVFLFASLRLWITLAILVFALRGSYLRARASTGLTPS